MDKVRNPNGTAGFWRCSQCGARFMGPVVPERKRRNRSHRDAFDHDLTLSRLMKRWAFPLVVIIATILAVAFVLDRRNRDVRPQIIQTR